MNVYLQKYDGGIDHSKTSFEYTGVQACKFLTKNVSRALVSYIWFSRCPEHFFYKVFNISLFEVQHQ